MANYFNGALADLYSRGLDISRDNPWALAQSAFPMAQAQRPGITMEDVIGQARDYFSGRQANAIGQDTTVSSAVQDAANQMGSGTIAQGGYANPTVTGYDPAMAGKALGVLGGVPGSPFGLASSLFSGAKALGLAGQSNLADEQGNPAAALYSGAFSKFTGLPSGFIGLTPDAQGFAARAALAENPNLVNDPEFMGNIAFTGLGIGRGGREGETGAMGLGAQAAFDAASQGLSPYGGNPPATPPDSDPYGGNKDDTGLNGPPGATPGQGPGSGVGPGPGESGGPGDTGGFKQGGIVAAKHGMKFHPGFARRKGTEVVPIKAHSGEYVVNKEATDTFKPVLEAMNSAVPADGGKRLETAMTAAKDFFDV
jgi:hypothetical protein